MTLTLPKLDLDPEYLVVDDFALGMLPQSLSYTGQFAPPP